MTNRDDEDRYQLKTYAKFPISVERGEGCYVYDGSGTEYLDFYGGHAVVSTGHCHPRVVRALQQQAAQLIFYSNAVYSSVRGRAAKKLLELAGAHYYQAFFVNSGSEANENAIKLARALTGRREIISLSGSFHGRTYGSLSGTGIAKYSGYLNTPVPGHSILEAGEAAERVSDGTAAVLVEPIQSLGGMRTIPVATLRKIEEACRNRGALFMVDEVQTGAGRTGSFLYSSGLGLAPDVVTMAKGIASGFPASAVLVTESVAAGVHSGDLGTTFGGGPLACACIEATLSVIQQENLCGNAAEMGRYLKERLQKLDFIAEVRGDGLLIGLKVEPSSGVANAKSLQQKLMQNRVITGTSTDPQVLRLMPPLVVGRKECDRLLEVLRTL